ncbi:MAG TPA: YggS family pyridoxal phosphate-dependent enzyme [Elusimicrobiota bacterium]|jgi:pyridoxal phosphate enzyme (YggS family)|nr:YggS family pyridoxal phosphate-dependent enzyme [Elusimicrobiota bacterium]HMU95666.1 YggS family pyridoxal phosphate-dependent enzyme [Elusimicrobiota bacterium]HMZ25848.1 YggS family pyridoxal phosphate-dependent enzyme [Elusimicrobiota bacterium]HNA59748.1 YggS family pyridoxal phosphate-dependent enzyme [Elusimicrobiota bacterium]HNC74503.1 YggS family pyridoxal phosphate-dependent enzyme [Elusimicrobiota bacterium]
MSSPVDLFSLSTAHERVQERLLHAARRAGRRPEDIDLVAVTKNQPPDRAAEAVRLGYRQLGESRVQEAAGKRVALADLGATDVRWHLIGHLQSNKARRAVELFDCVQSVDSLKLAHLLNQEGERRAQPVSCLVEVKISDEPAKQGLPPGELERFLTDTARLSFLRIEGLMGVAPLGESPEEARPSFRKLHALFERFNPHFLGGRPILSMGMSQDFEVAIEEGSTMIRVGTALFGPRPA